jgi:hypothetical protein
VVVLHKDDENAAARIDGKRLIVFLSDLPPNQWQGRSGPWEDSNIGLQIAYSERMETSPLLDEGTVLLPARMVYGGLGADPRTDVVWDGSHREVRVTLPRHVPTRSSPPREFTAPPFLMQALAGTRRPYASHNPQHALRFTFHVSRFEVDEFRRASSGGVIHPQGVIQFQRLSSGATTRCPTDDEAAVLRPSKVT